MLRIKENSMKKTYEKPEIEFDSFELSQSIAGNCAAIAHDEDATCKATVEYGPFTFFAWGACPDTPAPGDNSICYDVPALESRVFSS